MATQLEAAIGAAQRLLAPIPLPSWAPQALENIARLAAEQWALQRALPLRADISFELQHLLSDVADARERMHRFLDWFSGAKHLEISAICEMLRVPAPDWTALDAGLSQLSAAIGAWHALMSKPGPQGAWATAGGPGPELICARGVASLCTRIRDPVPDRDEPRRGEPAIWGKKAHAMCTALLRLSGVADQLAGQDIRWRRQLETARFKQAPATMEAAAVAAWMLVNEALARAGAPP
jgi:hypothetical protein